METKGKIRSFADIFGEDVTHQKQKTGVTEIEIANLVSFENHPFKLYKGERLNDLVASIKGLGMILPVVVRPKNNDISEILSGHNRVNATEIEGWKKYWVLLRKS